jgi:hypothetical protein
MRGSNDKGTEMDGELRLRATDLHWREIDEEVIALEARASSYLAVNPAGTLLWRALSRGASQEDLAAELVSAYGIDLARAREDTRHFLADLEAQGLLEA